MPHWPTLLFDNRPETPLERARALLSRLGNPQQHLPPVVHVAGTNGKGSTIAFLRAMLEAAGHKAHVYTSPHLHRFNERIVLTGREIDDDALHAIIEETRLAAGGETYRFFEGTTAAALLAFSRAPADILLMETGLGGRFDATNVVEKPAVTLITTISPDHQEFLGESLADIAWHKAGIMRADVPCVVSFQPPEALATLRAEADHIGAPLFVYGEHWAVEKTSAGFRYITADGAAELPPPALLGPHQYINAGNAVAALSVLDGIDIPAEAVAAGLPSARWPGRLERLSAPRLRAGWELWVDGGHNMAAGHMLSAFIEESWADKPTYIIFGTTQGKDVAAMLSPLAGKVAGVYATPVVSEPKSYSAADIARLMQPSGMQVVACESVDDAVGKIIAQEARPGRILVFGSLYLRVLAAEL